jgi:large subunit ribosomal protein L21
MFAVLESGNKQYFVSVGDVIKTERLDGEVGQLVYLDKILALGDKIGAPAINGVKIAAEILEQKKTDKVIVFKKKRRQNYRRKKGHRQNISVLRIKEIIEG